MNSYQVVKDFEAALCEYTGAKFAVTTTSCSMALLLTCAWHIAKEKEADAAEIKKIEKEENGTPFIFINSSLDISIPRFTYISVPMNIKHAGGKPTFRDEDWVGEYQLKPFQIWDCARWFRKGMYRPGQFMTCSFHWTKQLSIGQGGCVLHDNPEADVWLRRARFDGRREGVAPTQDKFDFLAWHCYMSPRDAAEGLSRLAVLPPNLGPLPNDDYPDLSQMEIFQ